MNSCDLGTKSSLGLNCYFTAVYILQKPILVAALLVPPMLRAIIHTYTRIPSIRTLPRLSYCLPSVRGTKRDKRQVRGFQEWQPAFARFHIRTVGSPDATKHSETYQESVRNILYLSLLRPFVLVVVAISLVPSLKSPASHVQTCS